MEGKQIKRFLFWKKKWSAKKEQGERGVEEARPAGCTVPLVPRRQVAWAEPCPGGLCHGDPCCRPLEGVPWSRACPGEFPGGRLRPEGTHYPVLTRPAASLPGASAGNRGTGYRQVVNEAAQFKWAEGMEGGGGATAPAAAVSPPTLQAARHPLPLLLIGSASTFQLSTKPRESVKIFFCKK